MSERVDLEYSDERRDEKQDLVSRAEYVDDRELRNRINPKMGWDAFRARLKLLRDTTDFPKVNPRWNGTNWRAVERWIAKDEGLDNDAGAPSGIPDGKENFDAAPRKNARSQAKPPGDAILDRSKLPAGHDGLSRRLHSVA